ncbi:hypothetical protein [Mycoplasma sp. P36-A1]|uniref:hypothetical protein n=1 Tax=Mycoplasma sp. P36-A1 TaxID=3252900 RepID=UPI003C2E5185
MLPKRGSNELVIAPPAYAYLLNYIDQDKMDGSKFNSFGSLQQFKDFKTDLIFTHFGVLDELYFNLINQIDTCTNKISRLKEELALINNLINKINEDMKSNNSIPSTNSDTLEYEIQKNEKHYESIYNKLNKAKEKLTQYRNTKFELEKMLKEIDKNIKLVNRNLKTIKSSHTCPHCDSVLEDTFDLRANEYSNEEDLTSLKIEFQGDLNVLFVQIEKEEQHYKELLQLLSEYESKINAISINKEEILKIQGYSNIKTKLLRDENVLISKSNSEENKLKILKKKKTEYTDKKKKIDLKYYEFMKSDAMNFSLSEITDEDIQGVSKNLSAQGSNKSIITLIWHFNLLKLKYLFNDSVIRFPIILDSPAGAELDDDNDERVFKYLSDCKFDNTQHIISTLGFETKQNNFGENINIIKLTNQKYKLLNNDDYNEHIWLLDKLMEIR